MSAGTRRIASFDIGKKNFAHYVEDSHVDIIDALRQEYLSLKVKDRKLGGDAMTSIVQRVCLEGVMVSTGVFDLRETEENVLDVATRRNIIAHLESLKDLWKTCSLIVVEQQYFNTFTGFKARKPGAGGGANVDAIKIGEIVMTWFLMTFVREIDKGKMEVISYGSQFKTQTLGAPKKLDKAARKKWSTERAEELYRERKDLNMIALFDFRDRWARKRPKEEAIIATLDELAANLGDTRAAKDVVFLAERIIRERQKLDDVSDTCLQCQAYKCSLFMRP
jgi:hypothetical protein